MWQCNTATASQTNRNCHLPLTMSSEIDDELLELVGGPSDKEKQTRKRNRDTSSSAPGKGGKASSKPSKKRKLAE